jgi:hypothetical protein
MSDLSNDTKKHTMKSPETIPLIISRLEWVIACKILQLVYHARSIVTNFSSRKCYSVLYSTYLYSYSVHNYSGWKYSTIAQPHILRLDRLCHWTAHQWSTVSLTPPTSGQQCHWHLPPVVNGIIDTAHQWSAVSLTPPTSGQQCHWHRPPVVSSVIGIVHQWSAVSLAPPTSGQQCHWHRPP